MQPDYLLIGHVTRDLIYSGWKPGGTVTFAAQSAAALGRNVAIVTRCDPADFDATLPGEHAVLPADRTTTFRNVEVGGERRQFVAARAAKITPGDIPAGWRNAGIVHLGPLVGELRPALARLFPSSLVVANLQGWLRHIDDDGAVQPKSWPRGRALPGIRIAFASEADFRDEERSIESLRPLVPILVVTRGDRGATVFENGRDSQVAGRPAVPLDTIGAGDVYSTAFAVRYHQTNDAADAADFAGAAAAIAVEESGPGRFASQDRIEERRGRRAP